MFEWLNNLFQQRKQPVQSKRSITYEQGLAAGLVLEPTAAGIPLNNERQLTISAFHAAVRHRADAIASLPVKVMVKQPDGGKVSNENHPAYELLAIKPNGYQSPYQFRKWLQTQLEVYGNAFAKIDRDGSGRATALHPLLAQYVLVRWDVSKKTLTYHVEPSAWTEGETLLAQDVIHLQGGITLDGLTGVNPIEYNRESMALSIAMEKFGASFFGHGARPSGVLKAPTGVSENAKKNLIESWKRAYTGTGKTGEVPVLEEGIEFDPFEINNDEAQYTESKQHQIREIARWLKIPAHKLNSLERATWNNIENQELDYVRSSLAPDICKMEQEFTRKLLLPSEQVTVTIEFDVSGLLRGDSATRYANHASALQAGWKTVNEVRLEEGLPPIEGYDDLRLPLTHGSAQNGAGEGLADNQGQDQQEGSESEPEAEEEAFNTDQEKVAD